MTLGDPGDHVGLQCSYIGGFYCSSLIFMSLVNLYIPGRPCCPCWILVSLVDPCVTRGPQCPWCILWTSDSLEDLGVSSASMCPWKTSMSLVDLGFLEEPIVPAKPQCSYCFQLSLVDPRVYDEPQCSLRIQIFLQESSVSGGPSVPYNLVSLVVPGVQSLLADFPPSLCAALASWLSSPFSCSVGHGQGSVGQAQARRSHEAALTTFVPYPIRCPPAVLAPRLLLYQLALGLCGYGQIIKTHFTESCVPIAFSCICV